MRNKNEKIHETREVVAIEGKATYRYLTITAEDGQEAYIFPQVELLNNKWVFILCNSYDNKAGIQNIYTT